MNSRQVLSASTIVGIAVAAAPALGDDMYAIDSGVDALYVFDSVTGAVVRTIGPLNPDPARFSTPVSLAIDFRGNLYVINNSPASDAGLSRIDPATGLATNIGGDVQSSIAFDDGGRLYGVGPDGRLGRVNTANGLTTSLGGDVLPTIYGLDFNRVDGHLYAVAGAPLGRPRLLKINTVSGRIVADIAMNERTSPLPGAIAFRRTNHLVMTDLGGVLWEVNWMTGVMTRVARTSQDPQGLAIVPCIADFDRNGKVDLFDFLAYQNAFDQSDPRADLDGDGRFTLFDFLIYQNAFDAGCP